MSDVEIMGAQSRQTVTLKIVDPKCFEQEKNYTLDAQRLSKLLWDNIPSGTFDLMLEDLNDRAEGAQSEVANLIGEFVRR